MSKALIVDDNQINRDTLKLFFKRHFPSMTLEEASNGKEAIGKVGSFQPDLVMMDIQLPDVSGLELTKNIKLRNPTVKVLISTGHHYPEYKEMAIRYGADGLFVKGESSKELLAMVEAFFPKVE